MSWKHMTVGECCSTISETYHGNDKQVILVNTSDVLEGDILNHQLVENKGLKGQFKKTFRKNDILFSEIRPANKRFAFVDFSNTERYIASTKLMVLRPNTDVVIPRFLFAFLKSADVLAELQHLAETRSGTFPQITFSSELAPMPIDVPDFETQKKIVGVLDVIENKMKENARINKNLEQQIEAVFDSKYAPSLCRSNWKVGTIGDVVTLQRGYDLPKEKMIPGSYPVAGSTGTIFYHNDYTTEAPCVVMGRSGNIGKPRLYMEKCWAHNTTLFVKDFKGNNPYWAYYMLRTIDYSQFQGGSAVPTLNRNHVHSYEIAIPPIEEQNDFANQITSSLLLIENNLTEIKTLSTLRDSILPKLMSGELDVSNLDI